MWANTAVVAQRQFTDLATDCWPRQTVHHISMPEEVLQLGLDLVWM